MEDLENKREAREQLRKQDFKRDLAALKEGYHFLLVVEKIKKEEQVSESNNNSKE